MAGQKVVWLEKKKVVESGFDSVATKVVSMEL